MEFFTSYTGSDFLAFYCVMLATSVLAGIWIPAFLREEGRRGELSDLEEIAVLAGGAKRHVHAVTSSLFAKNALAEASKHKLRVARTEVGESESERTVLTKVGDFTLGELRLTLRSRRMAIEAALEKRGLLMSSSDLNALRWISAIPYAVLFAIGLYRQQAGEELGEPTGFLIGLLALTVGFALWRLLAFNPRTQAGNAALKKLEDRSSRLKRAPQANEAGYAVAIFGTGVLVGTPWEPLHAIQRSGGDASTGGDGSDGGCGSGCGGGCGGCGG